MMIATGGMSRCDRNQNARCLPPVRNRAIEYAAAVPIATASTVVAKAMTREFSSPFQPRNAFSAVE